MLTLQVADAMTLNRLESRSAPFLGVLDSVTHRQGQEGENLSPLGGILKCRVPHTVRTQGAGLPATEGKESCTIHCPGGGSQSLSVQSYS